MSDVPISPFSRPRSLSTTAPANSTVEMNPSRTVEEDGERFKFSFPTAFKVQSTWTRARSEPPDASSSSSSSSSARPVPLFSTPPAGMMGRSIGLVTSSNRALDGDSGVAWRRGTPAVMSQARFSPIASSSAGSPLSPTAATNQSRSPDLRERKDVGDAIHGTSPSGNSSSSERRTDFRVSVSNDRVDDIPDEMEILAWLQAHDRRPVKEIIAHFMPSLTTRDKAIEFRERVKKFANDANGLVSLHSAYRISRTRRLPFVEEQTTTQAVSCDLPQCICRPWTYSI
ncbi:hypothetical protein OF83DRAFT_324424 [Amylostereum chailletii]|nr:hypothetical protein OF83DRAFT_324424 [Amylostereum chailletii]